MKLEERLANMSVNHKAKICNRMIRKVYSGTQDLSELEFSVFVAEYEKNPNVRALCGGIMQDYGIGDLRKIQDFMPPIGLWINPMKCEEQIDSSIRYYLRRITSDKSSN
jgi:hypothetical protein